MKQFKFILLSLSMAIMAIACNQTTAQDVQESNYLSIEEVVSQEAVANNSLIIDFVEWTNFSTDGNFVSEKAFGLFTMYGDMNIYTIVLESLHYTISGPMIFTVINYEMSESEGEYIFEGSSFGGDGYSYDWAIGRTDDRVKWFRLCRTEEDPMTMVIYFQ